MSTYSTTIPKYGEEVLRRIVRDVLREELILSAILKDSTGAELSNYIKNLDITLSGLRDVLKPSRSSITQDLSNYSLGGGGSVNIDKSGLDGWSALVVIVRVTYNASATAGIRVRWLYSPDGTNYDSVEEADAQGNYYDPTFVAGATRQTTLLVPILTSYVRIAIYNRDTTYAHTLDFWTLMLR